MCAHACTFSIVLYALEDTCELGNLVVVSELYLDPSSSPCEVSGSETTVGGVINNLVHRGSMNLIKKFNRQTIPNCMAHSASQGRFESRR